MRRGRGSQQGLVHRLRRDGHGSSDPSAATPNGVGSPPATAPFKRLRRLHHRHWPTLAEICDSIDQDCDGLIDEDVQEAWFVDTDQDGFGDGSISPQYACLDAGPSGFVLDNTDCNDSTNTAYPGADELCDSIDNNCDGITARTPLSTPHRTSMPMATALAEQVCPLPPVERLPPTSDNTDCDDTETRSTSATETCQTATMTTATETPTKNPRRGDYFLDIDQDGFGDLDSRCICTLSPTRDTPPSTASTATTLPPPSTPTPMKT